MNAIAFITQKILNKSNNIYYFTNEESSKIEFWKNIFNDDKLQGKNIVKNDVEHLKEMARLYFYTYILCSSKNTYIHFYKDN